MGPKLRNRITTREWQPQVAPGHRPDGSAAKPLWTGLSRVKPGYSARAFQTPAIQVGERAAARVRPRAWSIWLCRHPIPSSSP